MGAKRSLIYKIACGLMVATFFFAATPHNFIHDELASHKDTVDHHHKYPEVSNKHTHCEFLQVSLSPSLPGHLATFHYHIAEYNICYEIPVIAAPDHFVFRYFLRGPPETC